MPTKPDNRTEPEAAAGADAAGSAAQDPGALMQIEDLQVHFGLRGGFLSKLTGRGTGAVKAVDGINLTLRKGEVLGLVGESGSGKTTLGRALLGLNSPTGGTIRYRGEDIAQYGERQLRPLRRKLQMVFQDPHASLNPGMDIRTAVGHPLRIHNLVSDDTECEAKVVQALERVGLTPPERFLSKFPSDLSGGQKQRAVLARAIIAEPELLVADEPISMLDMSVRAKILQLMLDLKRDLDLTYVYVTHDLASAKFFCDNIAIMYLGRIVEYGPTEQVFADPKHPYTKALLAAIPEPDPTLATDRELPRGEIPDAARPPLGCSFHPRCPVALPGCGWEARDLRALLERRWLTMPVEEYTKEKALFADLDQLSAPGLTKVVVTPGRGTTAAKVLEYLRNLREEDSATEPREPFWGGVVTMQEEAGGVAVQFEESEDPRLRVLPVGEVRVACHLYPAGDN
ncbi:MULTISPECIES: ABC transporter ATP-binding protein [Streptomycetaceae]|uniref:Oligopeptide/dipeptide ABC transporter, ATPase subunit n=1 Tax=Streptantibioticus cattleyicolor (strain ATCC 35852 / DSM 46488 / JCM 4925 / NBRC 14057 / NRRL 8057) TaxID=1003195 RepID=F8K2L4_STREN|nr:MULTISPECIES: ABC transporter ATP-binding protein [Streptomycetaceae]AEW97525.1 oligopeptide/dipeptide ABC transporter, ATPase subunit [Streptantibioticus cattleyicolor NRRL 8057 = DSM 46488]MYS61958.1 ATP-binding cassette domain-containing protein [Streptomyces sp. SID5468]CCB77849.1 putative cell wall oligopeptide ABC transporter (ATP binding protein) (modular protein) [Streptantibioticus cattleyicolor NRRL 8057 = DSM 46488]